MFSKNVAPIVLLHFTPSFWNEFSVLLLIQWKPLNVITGLCYQPLNVIKFKHSVNVIVLVWPKVITLSGFYCNKKAYSRLSFCFKLHGKVVRSYVWGIWINWSYPICLRARFMATLVDFAFLWFCSSDEVLSSQVWRLWRTLWRFLCHWKSCRKLSNDWKIHSSSQSEVDLKVLEKKPFWYLLQNPK